MRTCAALLSVLLASLVSSCGPPKPDYDAAYDRIKLGMSLAEVTSIVGEGSPVTIDELPQEPKDELRKLPADTRFFRWGKGLPFLVVGFAKDRVVFAQVVGAKK